VAVTNQPKPRIKNKMKNRFKIIVQSLRTAIVIAGLCGFAAHADIYSYKCVAFTNTAASSTNGPFYNIVSTNLTAGTATAASLVVNSDPINIGQNRGFTLLDELNCATNTATANVTNRFDFSVTFNGTTIWTSTHPLKMVTALNGTNPVVDALFVDKTTANNINAIRLYDIWVAAQAGYTNTVTVSPVLLNYSLYAP
jgi:hypothetical protein